MIMQLEADQRSIKIVITPLLRTLLEILLGLVTSKLPTTSHWDKNIWIWKHKNNEKNKYKGSPIKDCCMFGFWIWAALNLEIMTHLFL